MQSGELKSENRSERESSKSVKKVSFGFFLLSSSFSFFFRHETFSFFFQSFSIHLQGRSGADSRIRWLV